MDLCVEGWQERESVNPNLVFGNQVSWQHSFPLAPSCLHQPDTFVSNYSSSASRVQSLLKHVDFLTEYITSLFLVCRGQSSESRRRKKREKKMAKSRHHSQCLLQEVPLWTENSPASGIRWTPRSMPRYATVYAQTPNHWNTLLFSGSHRRW